MGNDFARSGFEIVLFLYLALIGVTAYCAEGSANASASVESSVSVESTLLNSWGALFVSGTMPGRLSIRIPGTGLRPAGADLVTNRAQARVADRRYAQYTAADFIKLAAGSEMLGGEFVSALTVDVMSVPGAAIVTVAYN